jgi:transposase
MSLRLKPDHRIFVYSEPIDMRAGFNKLSMLVREKIGANLVDGDLYLFLGRDRKRCKAICYDGTGVLLIAKRMERGRFMSLADLEEKEITSEELDWLLRGSIIRRPKFGEIPIDNRAAFPQLSSADDDGSSRTGNEYRSPPAVRDSLPGRGPPPG